MKFFVGQDHFQTSLFLDSLDASKDQNNDVSLIDAFVDNLIMATIGFAIVRMIWLSLKVVFQYEMDFFVF